MAVDAYSDQLVPENQDPVIWRFMNMRKKATGELYFHRADLSRVPSLGGPALCVAEAPLCPRSKTGHVGHDHNGRWKFKGAADVSDATAAHL